MNSLTPRFYSISSYDVEQVKGKYADLYVIGFVDYIDQFAERRLAQLRHAILIVDPTQNPRSDYLLKIRLRY